MHGLVSLHQGGHLYGPGGRGEVKFDPASVLDCEAITETRELPGFVEGGVTYESHRFWIHFLQFKSVIAKGARDDQRDSGVLIRVNHGGGWEVWRGDYMLAKALRRYGSDDRGLFLLCWFMIDAHRNSYAAGCNETATEYRKAFVEGRLKKRKLPARGALKVWIEPPDAPSAAFKALENQGSEIAAALGETPANG